MPTEETYKRGQVEWALWRCMTVYRQGGDTPAAAFRTRIRRLLEIDRAEDGDDPGRVFGDVAATGKGKDRSFTAFDGFCLALGLELLDVGFKQSEVVTLLRHMKPGLRHEYHEIMRRPGVIRGMVAAKQMPDWPSHEAHGQRVVDFRVYAVLRKVEMTELYPGLKDPPEPMIIRPVYCRGVEALMIYLDQMVFGYRKGMVLELGQTARLVSSFLQQAPAIRRGRS